MVAGAGILSKFGLLNRRHRSLSSRRQLGRRKARRPGGQSGRRVNHRAKRRQVHKARGVRRLPFISWLVRGSLNGRSLHPNPARGASRPGLARPLYLLTWPKPRLNRNQQSGSKLLSLSGAVGLTADCNLPGLFSRQRTSHTRMKGGTEDGGAGALRVFLILTENRVQFKEKSTPKFCVCRIAFFPNNPA